MRMNHQDLTDDLRHTGDVKFAVCVTVSLLDKLLLFHFALLYCLRGLHKVFFYAFKSN